MTGFRPTDRSGAKNPKAPGQVRSEAAQQSGLQSIAFSLDSGNEDHPCIWMQAGWFDESFAGTRTGVMTVGLTAMRPPRRTEVKRARTVIKGRGRGIQGWEENESVSPLQRPPFTLKQQILQSCTNEYRAATAI
jgi:hypothetical protein